jgi:uridine kinase
VIVGLLHPGEMGSALGRVLAGAGHDVVWASEGRSEDTAARAAAFRDVGTPAVVAAEAEAVLSVCPPHAAREVADSVRGFGGLYVDANAIAPATARDVGSRFARFVDGGIVGSPPEAAGETRLYLSGAEAAAVAALFHGTIVDARVVSNASAVKATYAAWSKGTAALLLAIRAVARAEGVEEALLAEWELSARDLPDRSERALASARRKGWRWAGEMEEIAAAFAAAGQPDGFHRAAADVYRSYEVVRSLASAARSAQRVAVDGVDAAGKTTLAVELAASVPATHVSLDDFLRPAEERYRLGAESPDGYYRDSFDLDAFRRTVLGAPGTVVADGVFLQRPELDDLWDLRIFVDVPFDEVLRRAERRDARRMDDVRGRYERRYIPAQERYLRECAPRERADLVVDNADPLRPRLVAS